MEEGRGGKRKGEGVKEGRGGEGRERGWRKGEGVKEGRGGEGRERG